MPLFRMTHGPPQGILDLSRRGKTAGCTSLRDRLFSSGTVNDSERPSSDDTASDNTKAWLPDVRLHVFGHIHEAWGAQIIVRHPPASEAAEPMAQSKSSFSNLNIPRNSHAVGKGKESLRSIETVFVNAAVQRRGTQAIIVDLRNSAESSA